MTVVTESPAPPPSKRSAATRERNLTRLQARLASERARAEFAGTLNALEDKLNLPKQARKKWRALADERPGAAVAVAVGMVAAVGITVWLVVRANINR